MYPCIIALKLCSSEKNNSANSRFYRIRYKSPTDCSLYVDIIKASQPARKLYLNRLISASEDWFVRWADSPRAQFFLMAKMYCALVGEKW